MFNMSTGDLKKLKRFMKDSPKEFRQASSGTLNSLAFKTREYDIENLTRSMIIRNPRFLKSGIRVQQSRPSTQQSSVFSIERARHTGWKEQEDGGISDKKRKPTVFSRGGNKRGTVKPKFRLKGGNKFSKPDQFPGRSPKDKFMFMVRVLNTRGGGNFMLSRSIPTKTGRLTEGVYRIAKGKINIIQSFEPIGEVRRTGWRTASLRSLVAGDDLSKAWKENIKRVLEKAKI